MRRTVPLRLLATTLVALTLAVLLAACGGSGSPQVGSAPMAAPAPTTAPPTAMPAPVAPEERVTSFFSNFSDALSDPAIGEEAAQDEWAGTLAAYALPADRDKAKAEIKEMLGMFAQGTASLTQMATEQNLDIKLEMRFTDIQTEVTSQSTDAAMVELVGGTFQVNLVGADVAKLGEAAQDASRSMPITEFFAQSGSTNAGSIPMQLVDNVWYFRDLANGL